MSLELIYFKACPFAQRTLIALGQLEVEFTKTLINPNDKPSWIMEETPSGQIPLLKIDDESVLFDSSVICEYLNDTNKGKLLPGSDLARAQMRGLVEFAGECQVNFAGLIVAGDEVTFNKMRDGLLKKLTWLERQMDKNIPLFAASELTMIDVAFAPLFLRIKHLQNVVSIFTAEGLPMISRWSESLLAEKAVVDSVEGDFSMIFKNVVNSRGKGGFVHSQMNR
ncbi:MAG: glutathione S-transferase family protein [Magnetococcales bacterium]|nr:glutathione S-transferase family protein [Magnetococcales bacterium]